MLPSCSTSPVGRLVDRPCRPVQRQCSPPQRQKDHMSFQMLMLKVIILLITMTIDHVYWTLHSVQRAPRSSLNAYSTLWARYYDIFVAVSLLRRVRLFCKPMNLSPTRLLCPWDSPGKNTRAGCHFFLQFFPKGSSRPRDRTCISYIVGKFFTIWASKKPHHDILLLQIKKQAQRDEATCLMLQNQWVMSRN